MVTVRWGQERSITPRLVSPPVNGSSHLRKSPRRLCLAVEWRTEQRGAGRYLLLLRSTQVFKVLGARSSPQTGGFRTINTKNQDRSTSNRQARCQCHCAPLLRLICASNLPFPAYLNLFYIFLLQDLTFFPPKGSASSSSLLLKW